MRSLSIVAIALFAASSGCGSQDTERGAAGATDTLQSTEEGAAAPSEAPLAPPVSTTPAMVGGGGDANDGGELPVPPKAGVEPPGPAPSDEQIAHAMKCSSLQDEAYAAFDAARQSVAVDQCSAPSDCSRVGFSIDDGCWPSCQGLAGTSAYSHALKEIAADVCSDARVEGCVAAPPGCPPRLGAPTWACVEGACVEE